jgi:hypothetical protein
MWIFTTKGFYSIVSADRVPQHPPQFLLVRSRFQGDIEKLIPEARVSKTPDRDYLYRAIVDFETVQIAIANCVPDIDYPNFKNAVEDGNRHEAYTDVWATMCYAGDNAEVKTTSSLPSYPHAVLRADALLGKPPTAKPLSRMRHLRLPSTKIRRKHDTGKR